jgi:hypothetical protein
MKTYTFFIIFYLGIVQIFAQNTKPTVPYQKVRYFGTGEQDTLPYLWYETDSVPEWDSEYFNAYNKVDGSPTIIVLDSFIYRINAKTEYLQTPGLKGALLNGNHITKRNLYTGQLIWQTHYSDVEAGRQETKINARINPEGNLEVIGYRRARTTESNNFVTGVFGLNDKDLRLFYREYDVKTGDLLRHLFPESDNPEAGVIIDGSPGAGGKLFFTPGDTTIRFIGTFRQGFDKGFISILMDRSGLKLGKTDTLFTIEDQPNTIFLNKKNEYILLERNIAENKLTLHFYDQSMKPTRKIERQAFIEIGNITATVQYPDSDLIQFVVFKDSGAPDFHKRFTYIFMDEQGLVVDSFTRIQRPITFVKLEDGMIIGQHDLWDEEKDRMTKVFFTKKPGEELIERKVYTALDKYHLFCYDIQIFGNKILLSCIEDYNFDTPYDASSTLLFNMEDLGFPVSTLDVSVQNIPWNIYPNPVSDEVVLQFEGPTSGRLMISDFTGTMMYQQNIMQKEKEIVPMFDWNSGMYFFHFVSDSGHYETKKIVKI